MCHAWSADHGYCGTERSSYKATGRYKQSVSCYQIYVNVNPCLTHTIAQFHRPQSLPRDEPHPGRADPGCARRQSLGILSALLLSTSLTRQRCTKMPCPDARNTRESNTRCGACISRPTVSTLPSRTLRRLLLLAGYMHGPVQLAIFTFLHSPTDDGRQASAVISRMREDRILRHPKSAKNLKIVKADRTDGRDDPDPGGNGGGFQAAFPH